MPDEVHEEEEERFGELVPKVGGDPIPLLSKKLVIGRRESCDIVLRFGNVSQHHCELTLECGYWFVKDLNSRNGTRVNGYRITKRRVDPGDILHVAKHQYEVNYSPSELGAVGPPPDGGELEDILSSSLMESAGLNRKQRQALEGRIGRPSIGSPEPDASKDEGAPQKQPPPIIDASEIADKAEESILSEGYYNTDDEDTKDELSPAAEVDDDTKEVDEDTKDELVASSDDESSDSDYKLADPDD